VAVQPRPTVPLPRPEFLPDVCFFVALVLFARRAWISPSRCDLFGEQRILTPRVDKTTEVQHSSTALIPVFDFACYPKRALSSDAI